MVNEAVVERRDRPLPEWDGAPLRVLVVDDQKVNLLIATRILQKGGHAVVEAGDGREALERWEADTFDLVLMDIQMPVMSGVEATAAIRERERMCGGHVPIIAVTAHALREEREEIMTRGFDGYLAKPVEFGALLGEMMRCLPDSVQRTTKESHSDHAPPPAVSPAVDREQLAALLGEIEERLHDSAMSVLDKVSELTKAVPAAAALDTLRYHVKRFDFDSALASLPDICHEFDITGQDSLPEENRLVTVGEERSGEFLLRHREKTGPVDSLGPPAGRIHHPDSQANAPPPVTGSGTFVNGESLPASNAGFRRFSC